MIKVCYIPDKVKFAEQIRNCKGDVRIHFPNGTHYDLRGNAAVLELLPGIEVGRAGLELSFSDPRDSAVFFRYLMEAGRARQAC